jgi:hypothetical protein
MIGRWPDAESWAAELTGKLALRASVYEQEPDVALRRNKAAAIVGELTTALLAVPGVTREMILPLKDLMIFSDDMDHGVRHPWSRPANAGGTSLESFARTELRRWAVVSVLAQRDSGQTATSAYKRTASALTKSGRDASWRGIQGWVRAYEKDSDRRLRGVDLLFRERWAKAPCPHGYTIETCRAGAGGRCSFLPQMNLRFTDWIATIPHLRDRFEP